MNPWPPQGLNGVQVDIRFVSKSEHKTLVTRVRECQNLAEALRWAAECLAKSSPEDQARVTGLRLRILEADLQAAEPARQLAMVDG